MSNVLDFTEKISEKIHCLAFFFPVISEWQAIVPIVQSKPYFKNPNPD